jgi:hypothetical protein
MHTIKAQQGPAGLPQGKVGMSRPLLLLVSKHLKVQQQLLQETGSQLPQLYQRDRAWLVLGYFGMFRRPEMVALTMQDVVVGPDYVETIVRSSKTDCRGQGATVTITSKSQDNITIGIIVQEWRQMTHPLPHHQHQQ